LCWGTTKLPRQELNSTIVAAQSNLRHRRLFNEDGVVEINGLSTFPQVSLNEFSSSSTSATTWIVPSNGSRSNSCLGSCTVHSLLWFNCWHHVPGSKAWLHVWKALLRALDVLWCVCWAAFCLTQASDAPLTKFLKRRRVHLRFPVAHPRSI